MDALALDLDGVVWLAGAPIPGSVEAIARAQRAGLTVGYVTNNSYLSAETVADRLADIGIDPGGGVITSAMAAASLVDPGRRALVCGGPGIVAALNDRGIEAVSDGDADVVVVGLHRDFDYERLRVAARAVRRGARLIATNDDATYPTPDGPIPGGGAIVAAVATAAGVVPEVAGKPHEAMAVLVRERLGPVGIMVGDRPETDGRFAEVVGYGFALVLSGVTAPKDLPVVPAPDLVADDLAGAVEVVLGGRR